MGHIASYATALAPVQRVSRGEKAMSSKQAIVIGASIGGLLAARVLAEFFDQVKIIERDAFLPTDAPRKGVPQARHAHVILLRGSENLEALFPGLATDLTTRGALLARNPEKDLIWFDGGGYHARFTSDRFGALMASRLLLEGYIRERTLALPNVTLVEQCDALGLVGNKRGTRVQGLRVLRRAPGSAEEVLASDLLVDAAGRGSRAPRWLEEMGYARPVEDRLTVNIGYATRLYRRLPEHLNGAKAAIIVRSPQNKRAGVMLAQETDRWVVTLSGLGDDRPPTDDDGFFAFARSLPAPEIYKVIRQAEPLSGGVPYQFKSSQRHRYERLARFPEGFLVFGDAICSFNPAYGQGMSVAAMEALDLQQELKRGTEALWQRFFRRAAHTINPPWQIVLSNDLRFPEVTGQRTLPMRLIAAYMTRLNKAARHDPVVARAFNQVIDLMASPQSLMRPRILLRVLWGNL
jgi:2-polyprenyl-6-methoxyphenol hydroxylase-like FAD-dependent oxidoreductase